MDPQTRDALLRLNKRFYEQVAPHFDASRQGGTPGLCAILPYFRVGGKERPTVLDVGCGNGRFARLLAQEGLAASYTGVDGNETLLHLARKSTANLTGVDCQFIKGDLADQGWTDALAAGRDTEKGRGQAPEKRNDTRGFDIVLCTATVQHLPGYALRQRLCRDLQRLSAGYVILSFWQFLSSVRFRARLIDPETVGIKASELELGDGLLPWRQGVEATRYVHQVDETEVRQLAADAGLQVLHTFRADGREGDLNLYAILGPTAPKTGSS